MPRSTNEEIETSDWATSWAQENEASNASQFDSPSGSSEHAQIPNVEAVTVTVFLFEPSCFRPPGRGKRYAYTWHCCQCGKEYIAITVESCPDCGATRCGSCRTEKVRVE